MSETTGLDRIGEQYLDLWQAQIEANSAAFWTAIAIAMTSAKPPGSTGNAAAHNDASSVGSETAPGPSRRR